MKEPNINQDIAVADMEITLVEDTNETIRHLREELRKEKSKNKTLRKKKANLE